MKTRWPLQLSGGSAFSLPMLVLVWVAILLSACGGEQQAIDSLRAKDANVLLVTVDTLRADHLGCYGYERDTSPNIDALARRGVTFMRAYSPRGLTFPSIASIMTSKYPYSHAVLSMPKTVLAEQHQTLAEALRSQGYRTAGFNAHLAFTLKTGFAQGFHDYFLFHSDHEDQMVESASEWLERHRDRRFFAWVHFFGPHSPYQPPPPWNTKYTRPDYAGPYDGSQEQLYEIGRIEELSDEDRFHLLSLYDGKIGREDELVGQLLDKLDSLGLRERTLVILTADHGEELFDHHMHFSHEWSVYEGVLRIPLILSLPGRLPEGDRVTGAVVESIDLMPTILDLVGAVPEPEVQGSSLLPLIAGLSPEGEGRAYGSIDYAQSILTVRTPRWRYVRNEADYRPAPNIRIQGEELYDVLADPEERDNLVAQHPEVAAELRNELLGWKDWTEERRGAQRTLDDPELEARVRALGYVVEDEAAAEGADMAALFRTLTDPHHHDERRVAADALVAMGVDAVPWLVQALEDGEKDARWLAATGLGRIGPPAQAAVPALSRTLSDPRPEVRLRAASALGSIGGEDAMDALTTALSDEDEDVRDAVRRAIERAKTR